jgi:DNA polymerase III alpha subunit
MIHLALMTEFSFKKSFLHMRDVHNYVVDDCVGIADLNNTMGHLELRKESIKHGFKPIYGVRLHVLPDNSKQRVCNTSWLFIAKNNAGLKELYQLVQRAFEQFYYIPKLNLSQMSSVSDNIFTISPDYRVVADYTAWGQGFQNGDTIADSVMIDRNYFPREQDRPVYELLAGSRKSGDGYNHMFETCTYPQHILSEEEWDELYDNPGAKSNAKLISEQCDAFIPEAEMIKWGGNQDIMAACLQNTKKVKGWNANYMERLEYEVNLIKEKDYVDYFMIVADLIKYAKTKMFVGPARGSSAGSLVCYLLDITEVDPIEHSLIFERFIDVNRFDLPDIDIDFPDTKRDIAIKYLKHKYGHSKVMCLANINRLKAKSAIGEFAKGLGIPAYETTEVKDAIIERSSGDARAAMCIADTFETTEAGKNFIAKYPAMVLVNDIEGHASHGGKHAAGILVSTLPLSNYGALNPRDDIIMMDKKQAESINLLKIDCLGLRTLSILEGVAEQLNISSSEFYKIPLDDPETYKLFNDMRLSGVFQFEGQALQMIVKQMGVNDFNDISAITALARPGALNSGGTARYIKYSTGLEQPKYYSDSHRDITGDTFGIVVYQEQMMEIARRIGGLSWADTSDLRRAASKSMGDEFFGKYKDKFIEGSLANDYPSEVAQQLWTDISASGSWSFNKSHAVSYGLISYWTAWCKANYPLEFAVASLNHASSPENAIKLLRDLSRFEQITFTPVDPDKSKLIWSHDGAKLIGGLTNIVGIGVAKAKKIVDARNGKGNLTPALYKALANPKTDFDVIFPAKHYWGGLYTDPEKYGLDAKPITINHIDGKGEYVFIGCLIDRNLRDLNEHVFLTKRNGELIDKDNLYLNFKLEDDWDMISCKISRYQYESIGRAIAEKGIVGKSWYLVRGNIKSDWRKIDVSEIVCLNDYFKEGLGNGLPR